MATSNESLALALLVDASANIARDAGEGIRDARAAEARRAVQQAAQRLIGMDWSAIRIAGLLTVTVLTPFLIGHFLMTKTFVLKKSSAVYEDSARGIGDHFLATYMAGLVPILLVLGVFLVARRPWEGRRLTVGIGGVAVAGALVVLLPNAMSHWERAEDKTVTKLRETAFPFSDRYYDCESWTFDAEDDLERPELWQVHLGRLKGSAVDGCNRVNVYRGWAFVGAYNLPDGDTFSGEIIINTADLREPIHRTGSDDFQLIRESTKERSPMNPIGTNVELKTRSGRSLQFSLDGAGHNAFELR